MKLKVKIDYTLLSISIVVIFKTNGDWIQKKIITYLTHKLTFSDFN